MSKVFVTGADGMLGNSICRELINQNYQVKAFCLNDKANFTLKGLELEIVLGNVLDLETVSQAMAGCNFVIHIAALTNLWPSRSKIVRDVNINGTINIINACKINNIERLVHISSASCFNHGSIEKPGNENAVFDGWKYKSDYMESKLKAQEILINEFKSNQFPVVIINPTFMIGPYDSLPTSGAMLVNLYKNKVPGFTKGGKNFVCSFDVAKAAVNGLKLGKLGDCYLAGSSNLSYKAFFMLATKVMNKKFDLNYIPSWLLLLFGFFSSLFAKITNKSPKLSYTMSRLALNNQFYTVERAVNELDMPQTPIEEGIEQSLNWFKENDYLK
jgi:dihydroflavonol-4-reductase